MARHVFQPAVPNGLPEPALQRLVCISTNFLHWEHETQPQQVKTRTEVELSEVRIAVRAESPQLQEEEGRKNHTGNTPFLMHFFPLGYLQQSLPCFLLANVAGWLANTLGLTGVLHSPTTSNHRPVKSSCAAKETCALDKSIAAQLNRDPGAGAGPPAEVVLPT